MSSKSVHSHIDDRSWIIESSDDPMNVSWTHIEKNVAIEENNITGGTRWRSEDSSGEKEEQGLERVMGIAYHATLTKTSVGPHSLSLSLTTTRRRRFPER